MMSHGKGSPRASADRSVQIIDVVLAQVTVTTPYTYPKPTFRTLERSLPRVALGAGALMRVVSSVTSTDGILSVPSLHSRRLSTSRKTSRSGWLIPANGIAKLTTFGAWTEVRRD
jgi:hypothetical protein